MDVPRVKSEILIRVGVSRLGKDLVLLQRFGSGVSSIESPPQGGGVERIPGDSFWNNGKITPRWNWFPR
jgi:hypothetical protein